MKLLPGEEPKTERLEFRITATQKRRCIRRMVEEDGGKLNVFARRILFEYLDGKLELAPKRSITARNLDE